ncbi:MAG: hypothetical protein HOK21_02300 [Rhodospirillaceae bacterium]|nr:hypothetical protein [Rhodospirillaceae bacterium]MBT4043542.1 hypothetical protein [Rhodospirillaceae bacterium]MBT4691352.1 hypothetical protein [Rhodospirillaceae bacterium]MBT5081408.1 hypothetical protein [Rhodospirillaceae bacterium]MBT5522892.1 hypothetical protein [Rhodospirillaceae bacterium]
MLPFKIPSLCSILWAVVFAAGVAGGSSVLAAEGAVAVVEAVENAPDAGVGFLDYVYKGQSISLGQGMIVLSYFDSCLKETVRSGELTVGEGSSEISGGEVSVEKMPCQGQRLLVTEATGEAGVTVTRIKEQNAGEWAEWTVKSATPIFKWKSNGADEIKLYDMDTEPPQLVWSGRGAVGTSTYPDTAPALEIGLPYEVRVSLADGGQIKALFSIDPDMDGPDSAVSRMVPVRP